MACFTLTGDVDREEVIVVGCPFATRLHLRIQLGGVSFNHATRVAARKVCSYDHDIPDCPS